VPRTKRYRKHIACLESLWNPDLEARLSVEPVLRMVSRMNRVRYTHLTCNTLPELKANLQLLRRRPGYGILYFAFHGTPGHIRLHHEGPVPLADLAKIMGRGFAGWVIHFGTCETVRIDRAELLRFLQSTGAAMVVGYRTAVPWEDSAATDLLLLDWLQSYKDLGSLWRRFRKHYPSLVRVTGLIALTSPTRRPARRSARNGRAA
jgi:hypothetical protein